MWDEQQDIYKERKKRQDQSKNTQNEDPKEISRGVRGGVEVRRSGKDEHDECKECGDRMNDEDGGKGRSCVRGKVKGSILGRVIERS